ncbi:MAG TPA: DoxX family protein [Candidatus Limnocylindria bacterium]|nr:DoxX family protein [Candidatus Limnocylindria bacterium]
MDRIRQMAPTGLAGLFVASGVLHLVRPTFFEAAVPPMLPAPQAIIAISGVAELVCGAALLTGQRWAGPISAILLLAILPGNVNVALVMSADPDASAAGRIAAWARLPLQIPLIWAALQAGSKPPKGPRAVHDPR